VNLGRLLGGAFLIVAAISVVWVIARKISRDQPEASKEMSKETHGLFLSLVIVLSFNAGSFISTGVRGTGNADHTLSLVTGCASLLGAIVLSLLLARSTRCTRDANFWRRKS
jgi:hypothetical protein